MKGMWFLILSGICLGTIGVFVKLIGDDVSPFLMTTIRVIAAAVIIFFLLSARKKVNVLKISKKDAMIFVATGFFGVVIGMGLFIKALTMIPVSSAVLLVRVYPITTAILAWFFLKEKMSRIEAVSLALMLAGLYLIYGTDVSFGGMNVLGGIYAIVAGLGFSVLIVSMRYFESKGHEFWDVVFWPLMLGGIMLVPAALTENFSFVPKPDVLIYMSGIVFISTFLAYVFYAKGLETVNVNISPIIQSLVEPVSAIFLAWLFLGESVPQMIIAGGALIVMSNILIDIKYRKKPCKRIK